MDPETDQVLCQPLDAHCILFAVTHIYNSEYNILFHKCDINSIRGSIM